MLTYFTVFKVFKLVNPDLKMGILAFIRPVLMNYVKAAKASKQLLPNIIYPRKRSWKSNAAVPQNEKKRGNHIFVKCSQTQCKFCPSRPRI